MFQGRARVWLAGAVSGAVLVGVVQMGPRIPGLESLFGLPGGGGLNYSRLPGGLPPLSSEFLASILGSPSGTDVPPAGVPVGGRIGGSPAGMPPSRLTVSHPLTNDNFEQAYSVASVPFTAHTNAQAASRQPGEPADCSSGSRTVWYRYTPADDVGLLANTFGTRQPTTLAVFTGGDLNGLSLVDCDSDVMGNSYVSLPAKAGTTYYVQASEDLGGPLSISLDLLGKTNRVSVSSVGVPGDDVSGFPSLSSDGRYVAFHSFARLTPGDTNRCTQPLVYNQPCADAFVHDRVAGETTRVSVSSSGEEGNEASGLPSISGDGRFVSFTSYASNLVDGDSNGAPDIFVRDRLTGETSRVSVDSTGGEGKAPLLPLPAFSKGEDRRGSPHQYANDYYSYNLDNFSIVSTTGRYVVFSTRLEGLVPNDSNRDFDVFVHDRLTRKTDRVSVASSGEQANKKSWVADITPDGRYVTFVSLATNLVPRGNRCGYDVCAHSYVHDRMTGETRRVSVATSGEAGNDWSIDASISDDGRYVSFASSASNLVPDDVPSTNDIFVHDLATGITASLTNNRGGPIEQDPETFFAVPSKDPNIFATSISGDGRYVAYATTASRAPGGQGNVRDVFVHDRVTGATIQVSVSSAGAPGNDASYNAVISSDGSTVAFASRASNFAAGDTQGCPYLFIPPPQSCPDVFVKELPSAF